MLAKKTYEYLKVSSIFRDNIHIRKMNSQSPGIDVYEPHPLSNNVPYLFFE